MSAFLPKAKRKVITGIAFLLFTGPLCASSLYVDAQSELKQQFDSISTANQKHYQDQLQRSRSYWSKNKQDTLRYATHYTDDLQTRTVEDYQDNIVEIETLISSPSSQQVHQKQVLQQVQRIEQIQKSDDIITETIDSSDRKVLKTRITPKQQYWDNKAADYFDDIERSAKYWGVPPSLILAIIYHESRFNPNAVSHAPAFGLMQIMENSAAADVSNFYLKGQKISTEALMNPTLNIEVGSAYLHLLTNQYLKGIESQHSRELIAIAAYNAGIGAVAKHFTKTTSLQKLAETVNKKEFKELYVSLTKHFPFSETRKYVFNVVEQEDYYRKFLKDGHQRK
ncbi:transglycosylase SLT domain-containing protein [Vibrio breoganii]